MDIENFETKEFLDKWWNFICVKSNLYDHPFEEWVLPRDRDA